MGMESKTRQITMMAVLAALYIITTFLPFSAFIGGAGFITANVAILPLIAMLLTPWYALGAGLIGGLAMNFLGVGLATVFPMYSVAIVAFTALVGSIAFHYRKASWVPAAWLIGQGTMYLLYYSFTATPLWLTHYCIGIGASLFYAATGQYKVPCLTFATAMVENSMLNIGSLFILNLPAELWIIILPASFAERVIATVVAVALFYSLQKFAPTYFPKE